MSKHEIDDAAYEALKAHPVMVEEAMTNQDGAFWAAISRNMWGACSNDITAVAYIEVAVENYVKEQVEDMAEYEEISVNEAIHRLLKECNGGK